jgi:hypothetical protein
MLSSVDFFKNLLNAASSPSSSDTQLHLKILDILNWIVYNNLLTVTTDSSNVSSLKEAFNNYLDKFLFTFFVYGDRSTSRKATMLLTFMLRKQNDAKKLFNDLLLDKLLALLNFLPEFDSSASLNWYFMLMHQVMTMTTTPHIERAHDRCIKMLSMFAQGQKYNPLYALLKMRYNYSCLIFESRLFDVDMYLKFDLLNQKPFLNSTNNNLHHQQHTHHHQIHHNQQQQQQQHQNNLPQFMQDPWSNTSFSFGTVGGLSSQNHQHNKQQHLHNNQNNFNLNQNGGIFAGSNLSNQTQQQNNQSSLTSMSWNTVNANLINLLGLNFGGKETSLLLGATSSLGLIEVLPLNFKCLSSSNGTSVDKSNVNKHEKSLYVLPEFCYDDNEEKKTATTTNTNNNNTHSKIDTTIFNSIFNFNPLQYLIVERMEPLSRHFVLIDFGFSIALTDIIIPACNELASLSIDLWLHKEQKDSRRLCVSTDIGQKAVLLNDLQPPAVCRYVKLIFVAHSTNIVKAKIPLGHYFGFPLIFNSSSNELSSEILPTVSTTTTTPSSTTTESVEVVQENEANNKKLISGYLSYLEKLYQDKKCHYFMSLGKLRELLNEINFPSDNIGHLKMMQFNADSNEATLRIKEAYGECLDNQFQFNLNAQLVKKLRASLGMRQDDGYDDGGGHAAIWSLRKFDAIPAVNYELEKQVNEMSQDKLRVCNGLLIKTLLCLTWRISNERQYSTIPRSPSSSSQAGLGKNRENSLFILALNLRNLKFSF